MSYSKNRLASQPPLRKINQEYYNPFIHTPPTGLEKNIILRSLGPRQPVSVTQTQKYDTKLGEDADKDDSYGQFLEIGGRKRKQSRKRRQKSISKKNKSKKNKSKKRNIKNYRR